MGAPAQGLSELVNAEIEHRKELERSAEELERSAKEAERRRADARKKATRMLPPEKVELLLRYQAGLSREFDRILRRLDVLQRMRRGQPARDHAQCFGLTVMDSDAKWEIYKRERSTCVQRFLSRQKKEDVSELGRVRRAFVENPRSAQAGICSPASRGRQTPPIAFSLKPVSFRRQPERLGISY